MRVRVGAQPTFTRYTFGLPALIAVSVERNDDKMTMTFEAPLRFDLADVQAALPPTVAAVESQSRGDSASVQFEFVGKVDIRTFREDNNYIVDVQPIRPRAEGAIDPSAQIAALAAAARSAQHRRRAGRKAAAPPAAAARTRSPQRPRSPQNPRQAAASPPAKPASEAIVPAAAPAPAEPAQAAEKPSPPATIPAREREDAKPAPADASAPVVADVRRHGEALRITFPFAQPTPAAVFRRADTIWLVFDSAAPIDIGKIAAAVGQRHPRRDGDPLARRTGGAAQARPAEAHQRRHRRHAWTVIVGDMMLEPTQPLGTVRLVQAGGRASVTIPFNDPRQLHRLTDAEVGDTLLVVTALGPARGFLKAAGISSSSTRWSRPTASRSSRWPMT